MSGRVYCVCFTLVAKGLSREKKGRDNSVRVMWSCELIKVIFSFVFVGGAVS